MEKKILVSYFSCSGVTKNVGHRIASLIEGDEYEIKPKIPYTAADLNWMDKKSRSSIEMNDKSFRPAIAEKCNNMADYDVVYVGFPIWWYVAPTIINTFLESYDFSGKTIVLFATSGGSGFGNTVAELKGSVSDTTVIKEGKVFNSGISKDQLSSWVNDLGL